jgi:hypothetical protein
MTPENFGPKPHESSAAHVRSDERGVVLILFALILPALRAAAALTINYAGLYISGSEVNYIGPLHEKLSMQIAADAAARSASMVNGLEDSVYNMLRSEALAVTKKNDYPARNSVQTAVNVYPNITGGNDTAAHFNAVEAIITKPYRFLLGSVFGFNEITLQARAVAASALEPCIIALHTTSQVYSDIEIAGSNTAINVPCGIYSNNPSLTDSVTKSGGATVYTYIVGMVGNTTASGIYGIDRGSPIINGGMQPFIDPSKNLDFTEPQALNAFGKNDTDWNSLATLSLGRYPYGIKFTGGDHTFEAGTYYFPAGESLDVSGGTLNATAGVTFVFEPGNSGFGFSGAGMRIDLTAPSSGPFAGISIASRSTSNTNQGFNSTGMVANINGAVYAPYSLVNYNAQVSNENNCLTLVADVVKINGGASLGKACPSTSMNGSGFRAAGLV